MAVRSACRQHAHRDAESQAQHDGAAEERRGDRQAIGEHREHRLARSQRVELARHEPLQQRHELHGPRSVEAELRAESRQLLRAQERRVEEHGRGIAWRELDDEEGDERDAQQHRHELSDAPDQVATHRPPVESVAHPSDNRTPMVSSSGSSPLTASVAKVMAYGDGPCAASQLVSGLSGPRGATKSSTCGPIDARAPEAARSSRSTAEIFVPAARSYHRRTLATSEAAMVAAWIPRTPLACVLSRGTR